MTNIEKLKERAPSVFAIHEKVPQEQLLEALCGEVLDLLDMADRVQLFNQECTLGMSKPTYKLEAIREEIKGRKEADIDDFCADFIDDELTDEEIIKEIRERGNKRLNA